MAGSRSRTGSGQFEQIRLRIRPKGSDPTGTGSATLALTNKDKYVNLLSYKKLKKAILLIERDTHYCIL